MLVGALLVGAFVWHSFRPEHPLLDLRLFRNRNLTVAVITMFMFAAAFFGGLLLVPTYFQQIRGESTLHAGLLVAPQGLGAMITMPIAGRLVDKMPIGRIVAGRPDPDRHRHVRPHPGHRVDAVRRDHPDAGRDGSRHGLDDDAAVHLGAEDAARPRGRPRVDPAEHHPAGLQLGRRRADVGAADQPPQRLPGRCPAPRQARLDGGITETGAAILSNTRPEAFAGLHLDPAAVARGLVDAASSFAQTYWVAWSLVLLTLVPALFLPRRREEDHFLDDEGMPPVVVS